MRNIEYTYKFSGWESKPWATSSLSFKQRYDSLWDEEDLFVERLADIKWKFGDSFDPYLEFVEVRSEKPNSKAPKLPESYPKGDLDNLLGFGSEDG